MGSDSAFGEPFYVSESKDKDFFGNTINVGDTVAFMRVGYRYLLKGIVVSKAEQKATIEYTEFNTDKRKTWQYYSQIIKKL